MRRIALWLILFLGFVLGAACSGNEKRGAGLAEGCLINSDCASPLVCAFRKCHTACTTSRDCTAGERCVVSDRPSNVCQLADERDCSYTSECPTLEVCGADQQCRDQCVASVDCVAGQICIGGTCAERAELDDAGALVSTSDAGHAPASGLPCLYNSDCAPPLVCRDNACSPECVTASDCKSGDCVNGRCVSDPKGVIGPMGGRVVGLAGKVELVVPAGSVKDAVVISIVPLDAWPAGALGQAFQIKPTGLKFQNGATLVYHYGDDAFATDGEDLKLANAIGTIWTPLDSKVDNTAHTISAVLMHLSVYGVIGTSNGHDAGADVSIPEMGCDTMACSGSSSDGCCPTRCSATTDVDCAGCGNGRLDPGETCDPAAAVSQCPTSCAQMGCQLYTLQNGGTCQAKCSASPTQPMCTNGDGCCPPGCNTTNDSDCKAACGNGLVEPGELCDGNCPSKCLPAGCQRRTLQGSAATCDAHCVDATVQAACVDGDACCPAGCNATSDADCMPRCGNGIVDGNEICDGNCPTSCPPVGCQLRVLQGSAAACNATCVDSAQQTGCANNDGCCPANCNSTNDTDCKPSCGNGITESGETCDPVANCNALQAMCVDDANNVATASGSAANCTFVCTKAQRACGPADTYCPKNVACGPTTDGDCSGCGNGRVEPGIGETCDPPSACTTQQRACVSNADNIRTSSGSTAACTYKCTTTPRTCGPADGFCPTGCGPTMDVDCPGCGNGKIEAGETCDVAPATTTCAGINCNDGNACTTDTRNGSDAACNVTCSHTMITACSMTGDGCCPSGCNATNDLDCKAVCGNGVREGGETCDVAPASPLCASIACDDKNACTTDIRNGSDTQCNVTCSNVPITACVKGDGCCPGGGRGACNATNDGDCAPVCGNGVLESGETCDVAPASPVCSSISCDDGNTCTVDTRNGADNTCNVTCSHAAITACSQTKDGCCPTGCNANTDVDCPSVCGNGLLEPGETCETGVRGSCPAGCAPNGCILPDLVNGGTCTAACVDQGRRQTACADNDSCCPAGCTDYNDNDCPTKNDTCVNATDITGGGDFGFSLLTAKDEGTTPSCGAGADVYFKFTLNTDSGVYLDIFDPAGNNVNAQLELYSGGCPPAARLVAQLCDGSSGSKQCNTGNSWPQIFNPALVKGTYFVVARTLNATPGRYNLRFQRAPTQCLGTSLLRAPTIVQTCPSQNVEPSKCGGVGADTIFYWSKCTAQSLSVNTCSGRTLIDTVLQIRTGSMDVDPTSGTCVFSPTDKTARVIACNDDDTTCAGSELASIITAAGKGVRGLVTVAVDTAVRTTCQGYAFAFNYAVQ